MLLKKKKGYNKINAIMKYTFIKKHNKVSKTINILLNTSTENKLIYIHW
jgi:hypothetical protein